MQLPPTDSAHEGRTSRDPYAPWQSSRFPGILKGTHGKTGQVKWRVRYRTPGSPFQTSRTFETLDQAKRFRAEVQTEQQAHRDGRRSVPAPRQTMRFEDWATQNYIELRTNPRTIRAYQRNIGAIRKVDPEFLDLRLGVISQLEVDRLKAKLMTQGRGGKGYANNYVNAVLATVIGVLNSAAANRHIEPHGVRVARLKGAAPKPTPRQDELLSIVSAAKPWYQAVIATAAILGLRSGEVRGLTLGSIEGLAHSLREGWVFSPDPNAWEVRVHRQLLVDGSALEPVKREHRRELYPDEAAMVVLCAHLNTYGPGPDGLVFQWFTPKGRPRQAPLQHQPYKYELARASSVGVGRAYTTHSLRRFHATTRLEAGEPVRQVSDDLGHTSTELTQRIYNAVQKRRRASGLAEFRAVAGALRAPDDAAMRGVTLLRSV